MKISITCKCGAVLRVDVRLAGQTLVCPGCGLQNSLNAPAVGIPAPALGVLVQELPPPAEVDQTQPTRESMTRKAETVELPGWIVLPIFGYLALIGGLIALAGWWIAAPASESAANAPIQVTDKSPVVAAPPIIAKTEPAHFAEPVAEQRRGESFVLPRRMPTGDVELPMAPLLDPVKNAVEPAETISEKPAPISWALEKSATGSMPMVEISARVNADLHYSVRRLRLPEEAVKPLRLAVTPAGHDDVGSILKGMGEGYRYRELRNQDLFSQQSLHDHDVLFLTCADIFSQDFQAVLPLRNFVEKGGTLYASDLRGDVVLAAFPEFRARAPIWPGVPQRVDASVVEPGLRAYLQRKTIPLTFEAPGWRPAAFDPKKVTVCLQGAYRDQNGQTAVVPLLVKFRVQQGTVIFTSFHHAKNDSIFVRKLLDYLVFASVSARSEARVRELMHRYDFAPQDLRPVLLTAGQKTAATYQHPGGSLQIAIGFEHQGAKLKLTLRSPTGQTIEHDDQGIFLIDVPKAAAGAWQYTITPIELPHENFPSVVAIGATKS